MVDSFATAADLAKRLKVAAFSGDALDQVDVLLDDASAHLRGLIGWQVYPVVTVTQRIRAQGELDLPLPGAPIGAVASVSLNGVLVPSGVYSVFDGRLTRANAFSFTYSHHCVLPWWGIVDVTYAVGYAAPPPDLVSWTCVLASQVLATATDLGALGSGEVSTLQLGMDYRISWTQGEGAGFSLPARVEDALRARYGAGVYVTTG